MFIQINDSCYFKTAADAEEVRTAQVKAAATEQTYQSLKD